MACASRKFGRVICISSINGQKGQAGQVNYSAAKSGDIGFIKALAQEGARVGITVNAICPGYIATEMVKAVAPEVMAKNILPQIPVGRLGEPEEIARCGGVPGRRRRRLHHRLDDFAPTAASISREARRADGAYKSSGAGAAALTRAAQRPLLHRGEKRQTGGDRQRHQAEGGAKRAGPRRRDRRRLATLLSPSP